MDNEFSDEEEYHGLDQLLDRTDHSIDCSVFAMYLAF